MSIIAIIFAVLTFLVIAISLGLALPAPGSVIVFVGWYSIVGIVLLGYLTL